MSPSLTPPPLRVVIADDEPPARRRIRALLEPQTDVEIVGESATGRDTIAAVERARPDLLFLDVQMPEGSGFDVVAALGPSRPPAVVFVTAYDEFALRAFDVHAVDYLLKPFERDRFLTALDRAREQVRRRADTGADARLLALLAEVGRAAHAYVERFPVRVGRRIRLVDVADIDYVQADANYVWLHAGGRSYLVRETMGNVEAKLDPARFLRIHRSTIVRIDRVQEVEPLVQGEYVLLLRSGAKLTSARSYRDRVREVLNLAP